MRSRNVWVSLLLSALCAGAAAGCFVYAHGLGQEARWLLERGTAEGFEYALTFDGSHAEAQLQTLNARRDVLSQVHAWRGGGELLVILALAFAVAAWVNWLRHRLALTEERIEGPVAVR